MQDALLGVGRRVMAWTSIGKDAFLYGGSAIFAVMTALFAVSADYRAWGEMAAISYGLAAAICLWALVSSRRDGRIVRSYSLLRRFVLVGVLFGAVIVPLLSELTWRAEALPGKHAQVEVAAIERAGDRLAHGQSPYLRHPATVGISPSSDNKSIDANSYFAYFPGMATFGLLNVVPGPRELTDARLLLAVFTLVIGAIALTFKGATVGRRGRALQFLVVLPSGALPMVTGGDDLPVLALMLLGLVLAAKRRPVLCGAVLGVAGTLKFTAWPLIVLLLFAIRDENARPARGRYALAVATIVVPVVGSAFAAAPGAFIENVIRFPLGVAGVHSPAASPLLGEVLVSIFPHDRSLITAVMLAIGVLLVAYGVRRFTPRTPADVARFTGFAMLLATVLTPATRFGYLIYPANLFVWGYLLDGFAPAVAAEKPYEASLTSNTRTSTVLVGAAAAPPRAGLRDELAGLTTIPTSQ